MTTVLRAIPCDGYPCQREHVVQRVGPAFATYHTDDVERVREVLRLTDVVTDLLGSVKDLLMSHEEVCALRVMDTCIVTHAARAAIAKAEGR